MREMKDSGIEWIDEIPLDWTAKPLKWMVKFGKGLPITKDNLIEQGVPVVSYGQIHSKINNGTHLKDDLIRFVSERYLESNPLSLGKKGDVFFADTSEDYAGIGNAVLVDIDTPVFAGYHTVIVRPDDQSYSRYLAYLFLTDAWRSQLCSRASGIKVFSITQGLLKKTTVILPPAEKAVAMTDYLDRKCSQIDAIIDRQQEVIEKLKAYKLSIITEAVTKGLNSDVPMKDSGVEWIGEIPEYWQLSHIGNLVEMGSGGTPDRKKPEYWENGNIPWMSSGEINDEYIYSTAEHITELGLQNSNAKILPVNTVMLGLIGQGKTKGLTAILKTEVCCNQNLAYLITDEKYLHYRYLFYCFKAMYFYIRGLVGESQAGIYSYFLKKLHIPLPDIEQQIRISDYLDTKCEAIKSSINKQERIIEKFTGYKKALIYEVVTGKKEV